jgi:hypothetical protein
MISLRKRFPTRIARTALLAVCLLLVVGCFGDACTVNGTVTLDGEPVPGGTVIFTDPPNADVRSTVIKDGTYSLQLLQGYTYTVTLTNATAPAPGVIPDRYAQDTGLTYSVPITNKLDRPFPFNIDLKP